MILLLLLPFWVYATTDCTTLAQEQGLDYLKKTYPFASIQITEPVLWPKGSNPLTCSKKDTTFTFQPSWDSHRLFFTLHTQHQRLPLKLAFQATFSCLKAKKNLFTKEPLSEGLFETTPFVLEKSQPGLPHLLVPPADAFFLQKKMSASSILAGKCLLKTQITDLPDLQKGQAVRICIRSHNIELITDGTLMTTGFLNKPATVITKMTKKILSGTLTTGGYVEVNL